MIVELYVEGENIKGRKKVTCEYKTKENRILAIATDDFHEGKTLHYEGKSYYFLDNPKIIKIPRLNTPYPLSSKMKKTIGLQVYADPEGSKLVSIYYHQAITCKKKWIFKRNIGLTVYNYNDCDYLLYRVGLPKQSSYYFCLYNNMRELIGIIERHPWNEEGNKGTLYLENPEYLFLMLLVTTSELVTVANAPGAEIKDPSTGPYLSLLKEERELFDKTFLERASRR